MNGQSLLRSAGIPPGYHWIVDIVIYVKDEEQQLQRVHWPERWQHDFDSSYNGWVCCWAIGWGILLQALIAVVSNQDHQCRVRAKLAREVYMR